MTEQKAIDYFNNVTIDTSIGIENMTTTTELINISIKALEKQIPRELTSIRKIKQYDGYDMGNCPICGEPLDNSFYENLKYCFVCGQAIKWE